MKIARTNFTPNMRNLRKQIVELFSLPDKTGGKLPKDFTTNIWLNVKEQWGGEEKFFRVKVIESCPLPRRHKDFYLHRIFLKCGCCDKWCDAGHLKQHKC